MPAAPTTFATHRPGRQRSRRARRRVDADPGGAPARPRAHACSPRATAPWTSARPASSAGPTAKLAAECEPDRRDRRRRHDAARRAARVPARRAGARRQSRPARLPRRHRPAGHARPARRDPRRPLRAGPARDAAGDADSPASGERIGQALNDVVLQKWQTGRMLDFETWIDGRYVNTHGGDGLVVATATGSTAYALSLRRPDSVSGARRAGARADLPAHAVGSADRRAQLLARSRSACSSARTRRRR